MTQKRLKTISGSEFGYKLGTKPANFDYKYPKSIDLTTTRREKTTINARYFHVPEKKVGGTERVWSAGAGCHKSFPKQNNQNHVRGFFFSM
jgi:hypothetical protein